MKLRTFLLLLLLLSSFCAAQAQSAAFTSDAPKCQGDSVHFTPATPGGTILSETWDFGDGTSVTVVPPATLPASPVHLYPIGGIFSAVRTVNFTTGTISSSQSVYIRPAPTAAFAWSTTGCFQDTVLFVNFSFSFMSVLVSWEWNFGEPAGGNGTQSTVLNPSYTYSAAGNYPVRLVVHDNNGCTDTVIHVVSATGSAPSTDTLTAPSLNLNSDTCLAASALITLAGSGNSFLVQPGGHADIVAGAKIRLMPQTRVVAGGYLRGRIASNCDYCSGYKAGQVNKDPAPPSAAPLQTYRIFPNPASDKITILPPADGGPFTAILYCFDGRPVYFEKRDQNSALQIDVTNLPAGIYILSLSDRQGCVFRKVIKQ